MFKTKHQVITKHLNFRVIGQKINPTALVKYLGVFLNDSLTWTSHVTNLIPKLYVVITLPNSFLKPFITHCSTLTYVCQIWGQAKSNLFK